MRAVANTAVRKGVMMLKLYVARTAIMGGILFLASVFPTHAALVCTVQPFEKSKVAVVTSPGKSSEFYSLLQNNMTEEAIRCCVSCIVPAGTKIIITNQGFASHTIRVLEGKSRGCIGDLPAEYVGNCK